MTHKFVHVSRSFKRAVYGMVEVVFWAVVSSQCQPMVSTSAQEGSQRLNQDGHVTSLLQTYHPFSAEELGFRTNCTDIPLDISYMEDVPHDYAIAAIRYIETAVLLLKDHGTTPTYLHRRYRLDPDYGKGRDQLNHNGHGFPWEVDILDEFELPMEVCPIPSPQICIRLFPQIVLDYTVNQIDIAGTASSHIIPFATRTWIECSPEEQYFNDVPRVPTPIGIQGRLAPMNNGLSDLQVRRFIKSHQQLTVPELSLNAENKDVPWRRQTTAFRLHSQNSKISLTLLKTREGGRMNWVGYKICDGNGQFHEISFPDGRREHSFDTGLWQLWLAGISSPVDQNEKNTLVFNDDLRVPEYEPDIVFSASESWVAPAFFPELNELPGIVLYEINENQGSSVRFVVDRPRQNIQEKSLRAIKLMISPESQPDEIIDILCTLKGIDEVQLPSRKAIIDRMQPCYEDLLAARKKYVQERTMSKSDLDD